MSIISAILAIFKAIPIIDGWFQQLALAYAAKQLADHETAFAAAHLALIKEHDQTLFEMAIGSHNAGGSAMDPRDIKDRPIGGGH